MTELINTYEACPPAKSGQFRETAKFVLSHWYSFLQLAIEIFKYRQGRGNKCIGMYSQTLIY